MRKIVLKSGAWSWRAGRGHVRLTDPQGRSRAVPSHVIKGLAPEVYERGVHKRTSDCSVTPSDVRRYVEALPVPTRKP